MVINVGNFLTTSDSATAVIEHQPVYFGNFLELVLSVVKNGFDGHGR